MDHRMRYYRLDRCPSSYQRSLRLFRWYDQLLPVSTSALLDWEPFLMLNEVPCSFQITIPLLVRDQSKLGTAFGVWRSFNNSG
jgi:hypothetical protein